MARKKKKKKTLVLGVYSLPEKESPTIQDIMNEDKGYKKNQDEYW